MFQSLVRYDQGKKYPCIVYKFVNAMQQINKGNDHCDFLLQTLNTNTYYNHSQRYFTTIDCEINTV